MIFFISKLVARPLTDLMFLSKKLNPRNQDFSLDHEILKKSLQSRKDEVGALAGSLEDMRSELNVRDRAIRDYSENLEQNVKERTSELGTQLVKNENLIRVLCHDISNHIAVVAGFLEMLPKYQSLETDSSGWNRYHKAVKHIYSTIEILHHVKELKALESGKSELVLKNIELVEILRNVQDAFNDRIISKELTVNWEGAEAPVYVMANTISLRSNIFSNILSNAIKFSPKGSSILIRIVQEEDYIKVCFVDEGVGIPENLLKKIFDQNESTTRLGTCEEVGTGCGLPIVYRFIKYNKGLISVRSKTSGPDKGTEFVISLQRASARKVAV
jgi:signal transduction histidine kinase